MERKIVHAFRITHIDNIPHIVEKGLVRKNSPLRSPNYVSIGDKEVINKRSCRNVKGYNVGECIPFYFGPRSPMLYVIQRGFNQVAQVAPDKIVYCVIRLEDVIRHDIDCFFTDGHALNDLSKFYEKDNLPFIDNFINYDDVFNTNWGVVDNPDVKRRKEAELLIRTDLSPEFVRGFVVYSEEAKRVLREMNIAEEKIVVKPKEYYF